MHFVAGESLVVHCIIIIPGLVLCRSYSCSTFPPPIPISRSHFCSRSRSRSHSRSRPVPIPVPIPIPVSVCFSFPALPVVPSKVTFKFRYKFLGSFHCLVILPEVQCSCQHLPAGIWNHLQPVFHQSLPFLLRGTKLLCDLVSLGDWNSKSECQVIPVFRCNWFQHGQNILTCQIGFCNIGLRQELTDHWGSYFLRDSLVLKCNYILVWWAEGSISEHHG